MPPLIEGARDQRESFLTAMFSSLVLDSVYTNDVNVFDEAALGVYE